MMDWQPIESAPKDGTVILLHRSWKALVGYGPSMRPSKAIVLGCYEQWWIDGSPGAHGHGGDDSQYTHWMPLPEPPDSASIFR